MRIVWRGAKDWDTYRAISNARFNFDPRVIYYCESPEDVRTAVGLAPAGKVRIRAGGHQHEGLCSGEDVMILDVSHLDKIEIEGNLVKLGPGAKLGNVYEAMGNAHLLFPGGGCGDVRVGGLAQGGGWGPYSRKLGLTCDSLESFTIVLADGSIKKNVTSAPDDPCRDLFWAVCGGGGGNFGVVTEFQFRLQPYDAFITQFTLAWDKSRADVVRPLIGEWQEIPCDSDDRLTSFCRLGTGDDPPAIVGGAFLGDPDVCRSVLQRLLPTTFASGKFSYLAGIGKRVSQHAEYQPGPPGDEPNLGETCAGHPFPHKVSSCYPSGDILSEKAIDVIMDWLGSAQAFDKARRYLSLHSLGGAIDNDARNATSCFAFRKKRFMLQYQAWWWDMTNPARNTACEQWVAKFRDAMHTPGHTTGSFINFPDYDLVGLWTGSDLERRKALLDYYYAHNLETLMGIKYDVDPNNLFDFPMGIPPVPCQ